MITVTFPWWAWLLFCSFLGLVLRLGDWAGGKLGEALGRWWVRRREAKLMEWSRRG